MTIRISRNASANCINFIGSSLPAYYNACLSGAVDADTGNVNVVNDIQTANDPNGEIRYEFYQIPYTDFADRDGNSFADAQEAADYITAQGNVTGVSEIGQDLTGISVNFRLDETNTSIIMDNGSSFGVNTIKAVGNADGTIHIHAVGAESPNTDDPAHSHEYFEKLDHTSVSVNGTSVAGGLQDVVNVLNELFTVGAFTSVVISDPYSTMIADVAGVAAGYTLEGSTAVDPVGDDIFGNSASGNFAGLLTTATIDQAGEYYTFDIRGEGQIGFGLVHTQDSYDDGYWSGNSNYADPTQFGVGNSSHYGFQFSHWFHQTPNGSWTNYGANTGYSMRPGWSNWDQQADWLAGNPVKIRCGIDSNGYISIESLQDDSTWVVHARTTYPVPEGSEFKLGIKAYYPSARVYSEPKVHLLEAAAPTMYFRWIESPDGNYEYPLFVTEEEANYYDLESGGSGTSHTHTYVDDPTGTTWYMPDNGGTMTATSAPTGQTFQGNPVAYTEVTSYTNADLVPSAFSSTDISQEEGTAVNIQVTPAGASWNTSVSISPSGSGLVYDGTSLVQGTLTDVGSDTAYTVTVVRANSYGSSTGSMTVTATDVAPVPSSATPWTKALDFSGSAEHAQMATSAFQYVPMQMARVSTTVAAPASGKTVSNGHPWATACVFNRDAVNSNQHIWNLGDGAGSSDDNIYLRTEGYNGALIFGWGRQGAVNEHLIATSLGSAAWYGVYIGFNGRRLSGSDATSTNLANCFTIKLMFNNNNNWIFNPNPGSPPGAGTWTSTGGRMDRAFTGPLTIGGRGSNRSYHGKVASFVTTTLLCGVDMPSNAEIEKMVTDPLGWVVDYKEGENFRKPQYTTTGVTAWDSAGASNRQMATQIYLMGDGTNDSYSNMIRNQINPSDQNFTKLNMISMVSNDIQSVSINGLT